MKRSTLIFSSLLVAPFIAPFVVLGSFYFISPKSVIVVDKPYRTLRIDNPLFQAGNVTISEERIDYETLYLFSNPFTLEERLSVYYCKGEKYTFRRFGIREILYSSVSRLTL
jgi:hypothetical protein